MSNNKSHLVYILVFILLVFLVTAVTAKRLTRIRAVEAHTPPPAKQITSEAATANPQRRNDLRALVFTVLPTGFEPEEVVVPAGRVVIVVQNRSGRRELSFQLQRENGEQLHSVTQQRLDWKHQLDLHPGTYFLAEEGHPEWHCVIRVTPQ